MTKINIKSYVGKELSVKVQNWDNKIVDANETEIVFQVACLAVKDGIGFSKELVLEVTEFLYMELNKTPHLHFLERDLKQAILFVNEVIKDAKKLYVTLDYQAFRDANVGNIKK